jgi:hypothetical protein
VLREHDVPGAANIGLIHTVARYALDAGFHVVVEGILYADRYGDMLGRLRADHRGPTHHYYLDVPFDETLARHATKPQPRTALVPAGPAASRSAAPIRIPRPSGIHPPARSPSL